MDQFNRALEPSPIIGELPGFHDDAERSPPYDSDDLVLVTQFVRQVLLIRWCPNVCTDEPAARANATASPQKEGQKRYYGHHNHSPQNPPNNQQNIRRVVVEDDDGNQGAGWQSFFSERGADGILGESPRNSLPILKIISGHLTDQVCRCNLQPTSALKVVYNHLCRIVVSSFCDCCDHCLLFGLSQIDSRNVH